ncbi:MAG: hypothetical protein ACYC91_01350 [Solirubrobacteraceae bacterium]
MPEVLIDLGDGRGARAPAGIHDSPYKDLPYFVEVARTAASLSPTIERFIVSYWLRFDTVLTPHDVWFLIGDETVMPLREPPPCPLFRTYGDAFTIPWRPPRLDPAVSAAELLLWTRNRLRAQLKLGSRRLRDAPRSTGWLPLGMPAASAIPAHLPPIADRPIDVSFRGSIAGGRPYSPRTITRQHMATALAKLSDAVNIDFLDTGSFHQSYAMDPHDYVKSLLATKICLAPRGGSTETFRAFEAALHGCVVISEPLPPAWYYAGFPRLELRTWTQLPEAIDQLLSSPDLLQAMSDAGRHWATHIVSPTAIGRWVANRLARLDHAEPTADFSRVPSR